MLLDVAGGLLLASAALCLRLRPSVCVYRVAAARPYLTEGLARMQIVILRIRLCNARGSDRVIAGLACMHMATLCMCPSKAAMPVRV